jgi:hypothetical protein
VVSWALAADEDNFSEDDEEVLLSPVERGCFCRTDGARTSLQGCTLHQEEEGGYYALLGAQDCLVPRRGGGDTGHGEGTTSDRGEEPGGHQGAEDTKVHISLSSTFFLIHVCCWLSVIAALVFNPREDSPSEALSFITSRERVQGALIVVAHGLELEVEEGAKPHEVASQAIENEEGSSLPSKSLRVEEGGIPSNECDLGSEELGVVAAPKYVLDQEGVGPIRASGPGNMPRGPS